MITAGPTVLLLGGTSETAALTQVLVDHGYTVLVSTATDAPLDLPSHPTVHRRHGRLNATDMRRLMEETAIRILIDATHPFAQDAHAQARQASANLGVPYFRFQRPASMLESMAHVLWVPDHEQAAAEAVRIGRPILLTVGSRALRPYVQAAKTAGLALIARVLDHPESELACQRAGLAPEQVLRARGPFSVDDNRATIKRYTIGVLVTKDSGDAGGLPAKVNAAQMEGSKVVIVQRPQNQDPSYDSLDGLVFAVNRYVNATRNKR